MCVCVCVYACVCVCVCVCEAEREREREQDGKRDHMSGYIMRVVLPGLNKEAEEQKGKGLCTFLTIRWHGAKLNPIFKL